MARGRDLEAAIRISGELDASLRQAINRAIDGLDGLDNASLQASDAARRLSDTMNSQRATLKAAQRQYAAYVLSGERGSRQARELADHIQELSSDLERNERRMRNAEREASRLAGGLDDVGDAANDTESGFTIMKGAIANVIGNGITALIDKCAEAVTSLYGLAEETREFRQDMATLETAYDRVGFSAEIAGDTAKGLYQIIGEDDRSIEAANNIARMVDSQQDLDKWVKITAGTMGVYQDALPVESLAEAAGETAKVGKVTGTLADALNWNEDAAKMFADVMNEDVTTAEDAFNVVLQECTSEAERQAVITDTLIALYGDAADKYNETTASIQEARSATWDYTNAAAELGERMEPVTTAVQEGFTKILDKVLELTQDVDFQALAERVQSGFSYVIDTVIPKIIDGFQWIIDHKDPIIAAVIGVATAFATWKIASVVILAVNAVKKFSNAIKEGQTVMQALNIALNANPIAIVITLVAGLVAAFIYLWNNCESFRNFWISLWENIKTLFGQAVEWISTKLSELGAFFSSVFGAIGSAISGAFSAAWDTVSGFFSWIGEKLAWLNEKIESIPVIGSLYSGAKGLVGGLFGGDEVKAYAKGGFTDGLSIAGEAGTEAVISFDPRYRSQNLSYWAKAGQMLGASGISLSGDSGGDSYNLGGVTFAPQITVTGMADKQSIMEAIRDEYPEFLDMLEEWWNGRGKPVYG